MPSTAKEDIASLSPVPGERIVGRLIGGRPGPTLICVAALHGNEPAGIEALGRVFRSLESRAHSVRGELWGLAGNVSALAHRERFLERDLNRGWLPHRVEALRRAQRPVRSPEDHEQLALLDDLDRIIERANGPVFVVDLHTTSAPSAPFATVGDTLRNRRFARRFPLPLVLGVEERLEGIFLEYMSNRGHTTLCVEGGQHDTTEAVGNLEAAVWLALAAAGNIPARLAPVRRASRRLAAATRRLPGVVEVRFRQDVQPGDGFRMNPGWRNFGRVRAGEPLARNHEGAIHAPESGRILMPLYQPLGDDGFFVVRDVQPVWLAVSAVLRRMRADVAAPLLPGVRRDPRRPDTVIVDRNIARWYAVEVFHLLGFRRVEEREHELVMSRRRWDRPRPLFRRLRRLDPRRRAARAMNSRRAE